MFLFSLKLLWLQRLLLNETMDVSSWNVSHVLKTAWKWSSWSLIWEQDGTNVIFISHIHVRCLSCVISLIVLLTLPLPSSAALLKLPITGFVQLHQIKLPGLFKNIFFSFSRTENYWGSRLSHINPYFPVIRSTHNSSRNSDMLHRNCTRQATPHNIEVQKQGSTYM